MAGTKPLDPKDVKFLVVHCSASPAARDFSAADLDRMHRERGFNSIGYHYVIRRSGALEPGRPLTLRGAHVEDYNHCSVGICMVGGTDDKLKPQANFTDAQFATLKGLLAVLRGQFPDAIVQGHRDVPAVAKACPSFDVKHWLTTGQVKA